ncbi:beta-ketoacyl synthase N-terminal-like domain-containing protein [Neolewinella litorea]|uniref:Beta-ketoacyl synthase n=1 Tax=Neolewinella litorea TaxID=2562452 RepID=A0A4V3XLM5_9BACT|nr:beta-ketoacyl synthase N-terminal-like domain-containing protein [Neolewinella litorea]THH41373.1 beta-ketoacyl synthase [Neolewinella litorea]
MRYAIAGTGTISAAGTDAGAQALTLRSGIPSWQIDETTGLPVYAVPILPPHPEIESFGEAHYLDRSSLLGLHAADQAVREAGWQGKDFAVIVGCSRGPTETWEASYANFAADGKPPVRTSPQTTLGSIAFAVAEYFGTGSLSSGVSVTCSSGFHALLHGIGLLGAGLADRVLVGGTEAPLTPFTLRQMEALRVYAPVPGRTTQAACRPFDSPPSGMVVGEGAAFLALERLVPRHRYAITGLGAARERAGSSTGISREGLALQQAMRQAVGGQDAMPDFVIAHAPGTARGDAAEREAINQVFPDSTPPVTSFKWATGHTFGASGPLALVAGLALLEGQEYLPLPHLAENIASLPGPNRFLVNATGFGGNAVSVLVGRN